MTVSKFLKNYRVVTTFQVDNEISGTGSDPDVRWFATIQTAYSKEGILVDFLLKKSEGEPMMFPFYRNLIEEIRVHEDVYGFYEAAQKSKKLAPLLDAPGKYRPNWEKFLELRTKILAAFGVEAYKKMMLIVELINDVEVESQASG